MRPVTVLSQGAFFFPEQRGKRKGIKAMAFFERKTARKESKKNERKAARIGKARKNGSETEKSET